MDMRWPIRLLVAVAFSLASVSGAATLDFSELLDSASAPGNDGRISYSGNADFGTVELSQSAVDRHPGLGGGWRDWWPERGPGRGRGPGDSDQSEVLGVSFEQPLFVTSIDVSQFTGRSRRNGTVMLHIVGGGGDEGSGFDILFNSDDADENGNLNIAVNRFASSISFVPTADILSDFSIARITIDETLNSVRGTTSPIPEPSSVAMLLIGGVLVASQLRKLV
jgi:hypothetical protein